MKKAIYTVFTIMAILSGFSFVKGDKMLKIGADAPMTNYEMKGISGKSFTLEEIKDENGLLVIFSCNTCPFVLGWEERYPKLGDLTRKNNIGMVLVNSNEAKRKGEDSMRAMQNHHSKAGYNTPYVIDESSKLANAFGAKTTPHVYLFDADMKLKYRGSINDKYENSDKKAREEYLQKAIKAMLNGEEIDPKETKQIGCSIKRV